MSNTPASFPFTARTSEKYFPPGCGKSPQFPGPFHPAAGAGIKPRRRFSQRLFYISRAPFASAGLLLHKLRRHYSFFVKSRRQQSGPCGKSRYASAAAALLN
jgi:hypothetical protein